MKLSQFGLAADKGSEPTTGSRLQSSLCGAHARKFVDFQAVCEPLDRHGPERPCRNEAFRQSQGGWRHKDGTGQGELFHACGQMRRPTLCRIVHLQVAADGTHYHIPGVEPDADAQGHALIAEQLIGVALEPFLHAQCRIACPYRVVLVSDRRTKQRHDAVTCHLIHGTLIVMNRFHHQLEDGIEKLAGLFWIKVGDQFRRSLEIGEQDGHLLSLSLERAAGVQDLLSQMLWRIGLWWPEGRSRVCYCPCRVRALGTEFCRWLKLMTAARACARQRCCALLAELCVGSIEGLALGTLHRRPSRRTSRPVGIRGLGTLLSAAK